MEKKEQGQYPTLLTEHVSTLKDRLYGQEAEEENLPLRNKSGKSQKTGNRIRLFLPSSKGMYGDNFKAGCELSKFIEPPVSRACCRGQDTDLGD